MSRPRPPRDLVELTYLEGFKPAPDLTAWIVQTFIDEEGPIHNPDHLHLSYATIGVLWTSVENYRQGRRIIGQAELGAPRAMGKYAQARAELQVKGWFGSIPDFILTFNASAAESMSDEEFCALVEHELYHCAQDRDAFGAPKFRRSGAPVFAMRGHDVEEFVGVVRRYGPDATSVQALIEAAAQAPEVARASIAHACGTCAARAA